MKSEMKHNGTVTETLGYWIRSRSTRMSRVALRSAVCTVLWVACPHSGLAQVPEKSHFVFYPIEHGAKEAILQTRFELTNPTMDLATGIVFQVAIPRIAEGTVRCVELDVTPTCEISQSSYGNSAVYIRIDSIPPLGAKTIDLRAKVRWGFDEGNQGSGDPQYLNSEPYIQLNDLNILNQANQVSKGSTASEIATSFQEWINKTVSILPYESAEKGASWALENLKGDCTEMAQLMTAFCRSLGIPARVMGGYVADKSMLIQKEMYHNWCEYFDGKHWQIADPQKTPPASTANYIAIRNLSEPLGSNRFHRFMINHPEIDVDIY